MCVLCGVCGRTRSGSSNQFSFATVPYAFSDTTQKRIFERKNEDL